MLNPFTPFDWIWEAGDGRRYSSARQAMVEADDPIVAAFRDRGLVPTPWPPNEAGEQTDEALQAVLDNYGLFATLAALKDGLKRRIDERAEEMRAQLATPGAGQAMEYQEVQAQATAALKAPSSATAAKYPMLAASIGIDVDPSSGAPATDVLGVARSVDAARNAWVQAGATIRQVRLAAKKAIDEAGSAEAAKAADKAVSWTLPPPS